MGAWSTSITGNDTAQDLRSEYTSAFWYYDISTAVKEIDKFVRQNFDESDEEEWCNYYYSLADFMWRKGILTDEIREKAIKMIDNNFGIELWRESGEKTLRSRQKALEAFRNKLISPMPGKKRIKPSVYTDDIFNNGDIIAFQLKTKGKPYTLGKKYDLSQKEFEDMDGKYVIIQKICTNISWQSAIVPDVADHWLICRLFSGLYEQPPEISDISSLQAIMVYESISSPVFTCESNLYYFKRRKYKVIANKSVDPSKFPLGFGNHIFFSINRPWCNPDSYFAAAISANCLSEN